MRHDQTPDAGKHAAAGSGKERRPTWKVALVAGLGSTLVLVALQWRLRQRAQARRAPSEADLQRIDDELERIRAGLDAEPSPVRELLDAFAEAAAILSEYLERIYEESFLTTESTGLLRRLRGYDARLHELTAEIRCRRAKG